ncbi:hypothetical protein [Polynucleobacter sp. JS-JIR-5-A7]|uniref:hypothetical protein n=1 Tax=Polynucleobacter sp. JS-JIR-5-A7 TaxID=1758395 RepID=UPI001BFE4A35|nr:hypothetical protein [Polynucleobacter sp. JS-JIR-5-A7]QWE06946.1 hypothetical protein AOC29_01710 [Polynucleobacter sp. JS-JIR-5-A7]
MIDNKDLVKILRESQNIDSLVLKYIEFKKRQGAEFKSDKVNKYLHFFFKYNEKNGSIYGPTTFSAFNNLNLRHFTSSLRIMYILLLSTRSNGGFKKSGQYPRALIDFNLKLYKYFLGKKYNNYYGCIFEIEYIPELILSMVVNENRMIGVQHGFGYYELNNIPIAIEEIKFYKTFYSWYIGNNAINQTRFGCLNKIIGYIRGFRVGKTINWIGSTNLKKYKSTAYGDYCYEPSKRHIELIRNNMPKGMAIRFFPHPNGLMNYDHIDRRKVKYTKKPQWNIGSGQLTIMDNLNHTILYYFIDFEIPFLVFIENELLQKISENFMPIVKRMIELNLLFVEKYDNLMDYDYKNYMIIKRKISILKNEIKCVNLNNVK